MNGIHYIKATDMDQQIRRMDILGETEHSPIRILLQHVAKETSWDNPMIQAELAMPQKGFMAWFKRKILRRDEASLAQNTAAHLSQGIIAQDFQVLYQIVRQRDDLQNKSLLDEYLVLLGKMRSQFNDLKSSGDIGPASMALLRQTIYEQNSIFNLSQKFVTEKCLQEARNSINKSCKRF